MDNEKQLLHSYNYINDCWRLALNYDSWGIKDELCLPKYILTNWQQEDWISAYKKLDNIMIRINKLAKEKPEYVEGCKMLKIKVKILKDGVEHILDKQLNVKLYFRNGELII